MLDLAGTNAEGQRSHGAMGRGVRIAADKRHSWQCDALFRPDYMHDSLASIIHIEEGHSEIPGILLHRGDAQLALPVDDIEHLAARYRRHIVVKHGDSSIGAAHRNTGEAQARKRLRRGGLVHQVAIDIEDGRFARHLTYDVSIPDFFKHGFWHTSMSPYQFMIWYVSAKAQPERICIFSCRLT